MFGDVAMPETAENDAVRTAEAPVAEAPAAPVRLAARFLPSLTDVAFLVPIVFLFFGLRGATGMLGDGDTGWHIRAGQWMLANGRVIDRDIFSFTKPGQPWFAWEWLWEVIFGWLHQQWGMAAVIFASVMVIGTTFAIVYRLCLRCSGSPIFAIAVTLVAAFASSIHWLARPHLFTMLFVAVFYTLLQRVEEGRTRLLLWLLPLTVLWTNLHGGFLAGISLVGTYAAGEALTWMVEVNPDVRRAALRRAGQYLACAGGCVAASFINPYGYHLHAHLAQYLTDTYALQNIAEFKSLDFLSPIAKYVEGTILVAGATAAWNIYRRRFTPALLMVTWMHLALVSVRHIPLFMILAAPQVAAFLRHLTSQMSQARVKRWIRQHATQLETLNREVSALERVRRIPAVPILAVVILALLLEARPGVAFEPRYDPELYPVRVAETLRGEGRVFTTWVWGGYLIYHLYPAFQVFIDGRSDFYGSDFANQYSDLTKPTHTWQQTLDRYGIRTVLLPVTSPLAVVLKESRRWGPVYDDGVSILFRRTAPGMGAPFSHREGVQASAVVDGGVTAIARSQTNQPVIRGSQPTRGDN